MGDLEGKYHVIIDGTKYILGRNRDGIPYYQKKKAPTFVNKFGSGDSSYRDSTFWQFFAQTNWRNGAQQYKFDDPGKFWKSENIDITQLEEISLSKKLTSTGQLEAGVKVTTLESWRAGISNTIFGDGSDGAETISANGTDAPTADSSASGTQGTTSLTATHASFAAGQKIFIHQTRGTNAGNFEINEIASYTTGTITTVDPLSYDYTTSGADAAQVLVVDQLSSMEVQSSYTLTAKAWDGTVGGVLVRMVNGTMTIDGTISGDGKGYRGSGTYSGGYKLGYCGEGTAGDKATQKTANGNGGGGGGNDGGSSSGAGGGGGHAAAGTAASNPGGTSPGAGGNSVGNAALTTLIMGGAGGQAIADSTPGAGGSGGAVIYLIAKTINGSGTITCDGAAGSCGSTYGGGGGAGGSIRMDAQNASLSGLTIGAAAGAGASCGYANGGAGAVGRIHLNYLNSYSGSSTPTLDVSQDQTLADNPPDSEFTGFAGTSSGKIFSWDGGTTWTEEFDCRRLEWYESGGDGDLIVGDTGGTETAQAQSFQVDQNMTVKAIEAYLKKNAGTPGDITVRIETDSTGPSGTLADANATTTIDAFTDTSYAWVEAVFDDEFTLSSGTTYWLVLKTAAAANDNNYAWQEDGSSPSYAAGSNANSTDGGSTWSVDATSDMYFRIKGPATSVNCSIVSDISGSETMYFGVGDPDGTVNAEARIYEYDGTDFTINKIFTTNRSSQVLSLAPFDDAGTEKVFVGVGPQAIIYETEDMSTYTSSKDIKKPRRPGYPHVLMEYNRYLYAMGGTPELIPSQNYNGFVYVYDTTRWENLYPFDFTVIRSAGFYDAYLFMGTYHGQLFVFDTATLNPLFDWKYLYDYSVIVRCQYYFDDKLYVGLYPQTGSNETNVGIWVYDRHGLSLAHHDSNIAGYVDMENVNNTLLVATGDNGYVYKLDTTNYAASGSVQSSYFDANLPSINKLFAEVEVKHEPLPANTDVKIYYKFKESDSWTLLGTSNVDDAESATMSFPSATYDKKISLKTELNTSDSTVTPVVTDVIMKYSLLPATKWQWNFRLLIKENLGLRDRTTHASNAATLRAALEASQAGNQLVTFTDVDGTDYTVLFHDVDEPKSSLDEDNVTEGLINITLIEA